MISPDSLLGSFLESIGVQFVAPFGDELTLLHLATQLEQAEPWFGRYGTIRL
jgi:hypothetical protein